MTTSATEPASRSDEDLLKAFAAGERDALGALARRHERALLGLALGLLDRNQAMARDAVQNMWVRVIRAAADFRGASSVKTWLYRVLINECRTLRSNESTEALRRARKAAAVQRSAETTESKGARTQLVLALRALPPRDQEILLLCHHRGLTHEQAAAILGIPAGTLKTRLYAAMRQLKERLAPEVLA